MEIYVKNALITIFSL